MRTEVEITRIIISGSRDFTDYKIVEKVMLPLLQVYENIEIVSGTARGADRLGERFALENGLPLKKFPANWDAHGKSAGYLRNQKMADYSNVLVAFWDGQSRGTKHMIDTARKNGNMEVYIINVNSTKP